MISIIGAPFDLCGKRLGSRLGPAAVRLAGLREALEDLGLRVQDRGDVPAPSPCTTPDGLRNFAALVECVGYLRHVTEGAIEAGTIPIVLGGEHTLAAATVAAGLHQSQGDLAVLWIDAHADINTPGSSETGNVHGMPLAALQGMPSGTEGVQDEEWNALLASLGPTRLQPERAAWYGLREVDAVERTRLQGLPVSMHDVDRHGVERTVDRFDRWMRDTGAKYLWISFDVDALDPVLAPGTGTAVRGGLSYREGHLMAELLREYLDAPHCPYRLMGVDVVETNPLYDTENATAKMAVEWIASLFGKTILGK